MVKGAFLNSNNLLRALKMQCGIYKAVMAKAWYSTAPENTIIILETTGISAMTLNETVYDNFLVNYYL